MTPAHTAPTPTQPAGAPSDAQLRRERARHYRFDESQLDATRATVFWKFCRALARFAATVLFDLKTYGRSNVPRHGGVLIISNHQSYLDPVLFGVNLHRPMSYLAKSSLFANPYLGRLISALRAFPVRQGGDKGAIEETIRRLREGHMLQLFPEGSRSTDGEIRPLQRGATLVVRRAGVPIVPAVIDGSFQAWPKGQKYPRRWPVKVVYGKPLELDGLRGDEIVDVLDRTLRIMLTDLRAGNIRQYER